MNDTPISKYLALSKYQILFYDYLDPLDFPLDVEEVNRFLNLSMNFELLSVSDSEYSESDSRI